MRAGWRAGVAGALGVVLLWLAPAQASAAANPHAGKVPPGQARKAARLLPVSVPSPSSAPTPASSAPTPTPVGAAPAPAPAPAARLVPSGSQPAVPAVVVPQPLAPLPAPSVEVTPAPPVATPTPPAAVRTVVRVRTVSVPPRWLPAFLLLLLLGLALLGLALALSVRSQLAARRRFLAVASHDLRTPLSVIQGYVAMAQEGSLGELPPALAEALPVMDARAHQLEEAIRKLLKDAGPAKSRGEIEPD